MVRENTIADLYHFHAIQFENKKLLKMLVVVFPIKRPLVGQSRWVTTKTIGRNLVTVYERNSGNCLRSSCRAVSNVRYDYNVRFANKNMVYATLIYLVYTVDCNLYA